jgi:hypothetical protein
VSTDTPLEPRIGTQVATQERNWLPMVIAAVAVLAVVVVVVVLGGHRKPVSRTSAISAELDPYAASLPLSNLVMSESANLSGGKMTYLDGHIVNQGSQTVTGITVQVLFHGYTDKVAQNETMPLSLIRMREPYIDTESVAAAPLKPGSGQDFRLIFDKVSADWDGAYPEVRILQVSKK